MLTVVPEPAGQDARIGGVALGESSPVIDDIVREGARRMLAQALEAEVEKRIARFADERDERGHRLVVRNGPYGTGPRSPAGLVPEPPGWPWHSNSSRAPRPAGAP